MKKSALYLLAALAFGGDASAKVLSCDGCTPQEMFATADRYLQGDGPVEPAYVNNLENMTVRKYGYYNNWTPDFDPEIDGLVEWSEEMPVEPEITAFVQGIPIAGMVRATAYNGGQDIRSAWEVINNPSKETLVIDYVSQSWVVTSSNLVNYMRSVNPFPWYTPVEVVTAVEVTFKDGSKMFIDINKKTGKWERIKSTTVDSNNNIIPENKLDFTGGQDSVREYEFVNTNSIPDLERFLRQAELYQIPVTGSRGSGEYYGVACSWVNGIATCIIVAR
ncbi:hypothetical protein [Lysobacter sp. CA196]|uniref:hypothetical protein n=1 Tax=Lysobacter sp. CA196 TaxID=3455606 RepID=UPI003F8D205D